jgi:transcriptional accessory protein Tex/SPT6
MRARIEQCVQYTEQRCNFSTQKELGTRGNMAKSTLEQYINFLRMGSNTDESHLI